ncbi:Hypothetical predicted protein [Mytilus galloprovincialis]|uniref:Uncharacterized protein n=1 Tax=Mytilus galloprovincialis TaxID=29158 RepID=A0A8B6DF95_MYTGA|nr:Hypothetical predicted protein [Mytilus galloprovincialis]
MENHIYDSFTCSYCKTLDLTIPFEDRPYQEETLPKQIMNSTHIEVSNEQPNLTTPQTNIHKENKLEGGVTNRSEHQEDEVPTAPQISRNSEQSNTAPLIYDAKTKPKRAKKRDTEQIIELQLAESKAKISNLEELNKEYRTTIDMLSVKLGIPSPVGYSNSHPTMTHATSISALESKMEHQIEKLRMDFQHQMQIMSLELRHTSEINELKLKLQLKETECNNIMQNSSLGANINTNTIPSNNWYGFSMRNTQQTNPPPNWYGMPGHTTHATYQPTPPPVYINI